MHPIERRAERGFTLLETVIAAGLLALVAAGAIAAAAAGARIAALPAGRDRALVAMRNAVVEARAASAYDDAAANAILSGPPQSWQDATATQLATEVRDGMLVVTAGDGAHALRMRYPVQREALPQGAIVDLHGNAAGP